jgi:hypothetical protein
MRFSAPLFRRRRFCQHAQLIRKLPLELIQITAARRLQFAAKYKKKYAKSLVPGDLILKYF